MRDCSAGQRRGIDRDRPALLSPLSRAATAWRPIRIGLGASVIIAQTREWRVGGGCWRTGHNSSPGNIRNIANEASSATRGRRGMGRRVGRKTFAAAARGRGPRGRPGPQDWGSVLLHRDGLGGRAMVPSGVAKARGRQGLSRGLERSLQRRRRAAEGGGQQCARTSDRGAAGRERRAWCRTAARRLRREGRGEIAFWRNVTVPLDAAQHDQSGPRPTPLGGNFFFQDALGAIWAPQRTGARTTPAPASGLAAKPRCCDYFQNIAGKESHGLVRRLSASSQRFACTPHAQPRVHYKRQVSSRTRTTRRAASTKKTVFFLLWGSQKPTFWS